MDEEDGDEGLLRGGSGMAFVAVTLGTAAIALGWFLVPPLLPAMTEDLGVNPLRAGLAISGFSVAFALTLYPGRRASDRLSRSTVTLAGVGLSVGAFAALATAGTYALFLVGLIAGGAGAGLYGSAASDLLSERFSGRRERALRVHLVGIGLGGVAASGLAAAVLAVASWRVGFLVVIAFLAAVAPVYVRFGRDPIVLSRVGLGIQRGDLRPLLDRGVRRLLVAYALFAFSAVGLLAFLPTMLSAVRGFSPALAIAAYAGVFAVGVVVTPIAARIAARGDRLRIVATALALGAGGSLLLAASPALPVVVASIVVFGVAWGSFVPVMRPYLIDLFPDESTDGGLWAFRTTALLLASLGPAYVGVVAARASYTLAFAGFAFALLIGSSILIRVAAAQSRALRGWPGDRDRDHY